jgi:hypothetical protein
MLYPFTKSSGWRTIKNSHIPRQLTFIYPLLLIQGVQPIHYFQLYLSAEGAGKIKSTTVAAWNQTEAAADFDSFKGEVFIYK